MVVGSLGTGELIILLVIAGFIGVPIWAIVRAAKAGRTGWAVGIAVALLVWPISLVSAIVYLTAVHPGTSGIPASAATRSPRWRRRGGWPILQVVISCATGTELPGRSTSVTTTS
jgi:hypothetical protein